MHPTNQAHVNTLFESILFQMQTILGDRLIGLYLYGSLVTGDFDDASSDFDLLAATATDISEAEFKALKSMHEGIELNYPEWKNRIEIAYLSLDALKTFKTKTSRLAIISGGEPFHMIDAGIDWLMNWYMVREIGVRLFGLPPKTIIDAVSKEEFVEAVKDHILAWRRYINDVQTRPLQAYAILTMCRGLHTIRHGERLSKLKAAQWAANELPEWAALINNALVWRREWRDNSVDHAATLDQTRRCLAFFIQEV
jgi:predicted nucleotidyltransferase